MSTLTISEARAMLFAFQHGTDCLFRGEVDAAVTQLREGIVLADQSGTPALRTNGRVTLARSLLLAGHLRDAIRVTEQAESSWHRTAGQADALAESPAAEVLPLRAHALLAMGRTTEAGTALAQARGVAVEHGDRRLLAAVRTEAALALAAAGEGERALAEAEAACATYAASDRPLLRALALDALARAAVANGTPAAGLGAQREALELAASDRAARAYDTWLEAGLAELHLALGDPSTALEVATRASSRARRNGTRVFEVAAQLARADALLAAREPMPPLESALLRVRSLLEITEARLYEPALERIATAAEQRTRRRSPQCLAA